MVVVRAEVAEVAEAGLDQTRLEERELKEARDAWKADEISMADWRNVKAEFEPKLADAERRAAPPALDRSDVLGELAGPRAAETWARWTAEQRRTAISLLCELRVDRVRRGAPTKGQRGTLDVSGIANSRWKAR